MSKLTRMCGSMNLQSALALHCESSIMMDRGGLYSTCMFLDRSYSKGCRDMK